MDNYIGGVSAGECNVISGNGSGVLVDNKANGIVIRGNYIGTDATGARHCRIAVTGSVSMTRPRTRSAGSRSGPTT